MPRTLDAGLAGRYLMSSVLMTSTMRSEPGLPSLLAGISGAPVSAAATCALGGSADGRRGSGCTAAGVAAAAATGGTVPAAAATAAAARNFRRLRFGVLSLVGIMISLGGRCLAGSGSHRNALTSIIIPVA